MSLRRTRACSSNICWPNPAARFWALPGLQSHLYIDVVLDRRALFPPIPLVRQERRVVHGRFPALPRLDRGPRGLLAVGGRCRLTASLCLIVQLVWRADKFPAPGQAKAFPGSRPGPAPGQAPAPWLLRPAARRDRARSRADVCSYG